MQAVADGFFSVIDVFVKVVTHKIFYITFSTWIIAQTLKVIIFLFYRKKFDFRLFVGTGGMPSSHTATVTALTTAIGLYSGWDSAVFMCALCYCIVVISDAVGVRRAAGRQAKILNQMMDDAGNKRPPSGKLKELLGHTPMEAFAGVFMGIIIPVIMF